MARPPLRGFNHNMRYKGRVYHIQTEDSGLTNPRLLSHLYFKGVIIQSARSEYKDIVEQEGHEPTVRKRMQVQHKSLMKALRHGELDERIAFMLGSLFPEDYTEEMAKLEQEAHEKELLASKAKRATGEIEAQQEESKEAPSVEATPSVADATPPETQTAPPVVTSPSPTITNPPTTTTKKFITGQMPVQAKRIAKRISSSVSTLKPVEPEAAAPVQPVQPIETAKQEPGESDKARATPHQRIQIDLTESLAALPQTGIEQPIETPLSGGRVPATAHHVAPQQIEHTFSNVSSTILKRDITPLSTEESATQRGRHDRGAGVYTVPGGPPQRPPHPNPHVSGQYVIPPHQAGTPTAAPAAPAKPTPVVISRSGQLPIPTTVPSRPQTGQAKVRVKQATGAYGVARSQGQQPAQVSGPARVARAVKKEATGTYNIGAQLPRRQPQQDAPKHAAPSVVVARPAIILTQNDAKQRPQHASSSATKPSQAGSIFGLDGGERSLDEVILQYLAEDKDKAR